MSEDVKVVRPFAAWLTDLPKENKDLLGNINYVQTQGGLVQFRLLPYGVVCEKVEGEPLVPGPKSLPVMPPIKVWLETPKIPWATYAQIVAFFRAVYEKEKAEAIIRVFHDPATGTWVPHCPEQKVSGAHVDHKDDFDSEGKLRHVADIHSHNTMSPFFSGTDDEDEKKAVRLYGVVGHILQPIPGSSWRAWTGKKFEALSITDVVDMPTDDELSITLKFPLKKLAAEKEGLKDFKVNGESLGTTLFPNDFPAEWLTKVNPPGFHPRHSTKTDGSSRSIITYAGGGRTEWHYDQMKKKWVNEDGSREMDFFGNEHRGKGHRQPMMGFGVGDTDEEVGDRGKGSVGVAGRRRRENTADANDHRVPYDKIGPGDQMVGAALWAALNPDILVYLVDIQRDRVYRVLPDQKVDLRQLTSYALIQMKARKKQVSLTDTMIFGALYLTDDLIASVVETFKHLQDMKKETENTHVKKGDC